MSRMRPAQIVAETLNVLCPYCGQPLENPDNEGEGWTPKEIAKAEKTTPSIECNSCEETFLMIPQSHAMVSQ